MAGRHRRPQRPLVPVAAGATAAAVTLLVTNVSAAAPVKPVAVRIPVPVEPAMLTFPPFTPAQAALYLPPLPPVEAAPTVTEHVEQTSFTAPAPTVKVAGVAGGVAARAVSAALGFRGTPYVYGGMSPGRGLDCSALVMLAYQAVGISLPRVAAAQAGMGRAVRLADILPGDLLLYNYGDGISHVAMAIGGGMLVQASEPGKPVATRPIYTDHLATIRRVVG